MKKLLVLAALLLAFAISSAPVAQAQANAPAMPGSQPPSGPQAKIQLENPLFDFGSATEGTMVNHTFKIKNTGNSRLVIRGVKTSCGCTAAAPTKTNLSPGEEAAIAVGFDTHFQKGHQVRTITAFTNDPNTPQAVMTIQGVVKKQVAATPDQVIFGRVKKGTEITKDVTIDDLIGKGTFNVGQISNSNHNIAVVKGPRTDGKPGVVLKVTLLKSMPAGPFDDTIRVVTSRIPVNVDVSGIVSGDIAIQPPQVSFGIVKRGQGATRIIKLTNEGAKPLKVLGVTSNTPTVTAAAEPVSPGKEYKLTVELNRSAPDGQVHGELQIKTDDPEQQVVNVPFYGIVGQFEL